MNFHKGSVSNMYRTISTVRCIVKETEKGDYGVDNVRTSEMHAHHCDLVSLHRA